MWRGQRSASGGNGLFVIGSTACTTSLGRELLELRVRVAPLGTGAILVLIDDLAEVFETLGFPSETIFHLFDPENARPDWTASPRLRSWHEARHLLIEDPIE